MSIDAHCHIDLHPDPSAVLAEAIRADLELVAVTTTPAAFKVSSTFTSIDDGIIPALGMHPEVVGSRPNDIKLFSQYLDQVEWVGEVGLDGSRRFRNSWNAQVDVFERVLRECSIAGGRILSIHSRAASARVLDLLAKYPDSGTPVLHWFSGRISEVADAVALGCYFSMNYQMLQSKTGRALASKVPADRLLTESDAPFATSDASLDLASQLCAAESSLAEICGSEPGEMKSRIRENFQRLTAPD